MTSIRRPTMKTRRRRRARRPAWRPARSRRAPGSLGGRSCCRRSRRLGFRELLGGGRDRSRDGQVPRPSQHLPQRAAGQLVPTGRTSSRPLAAGTFEASSEKRKFRALERDRAVRFPPNGEPHLNSGRDMETFVRSPRAALPGRRGSTVFRGDHAEGVPRRSSRRRGAMQRGWVRLWPLEVDEVPIAAWYGWRLGDRYAVTIRPASIPAWSQTSAQGFLLLARRALRAAIEEARCDRYEMLLWQRGVPVPFRAA